MKEAGDVLKLTPPAIAFHKYAMMETPGFKAGAGLVRYAIDTGLKPRAASIAPGDTRRWCLSPCMKIPTTCASWTQSVNQSSNLASAFARSNPHGREEMQTQTTQCQFSG